MDSGEGRINPVAVPVIYPWIEYWPRWGSNQRSHVLESSTLQAELHNAWLVDCPKFLSQSLFGDENNNNMVENFEELFYQTTLF